MALSARGSMASQVLGWGVVLSLAGCGGPSVPVPVLAFAEPTQTATRRPPRRTR